jgi:nitroreductase
MIGRTPDVFSSGAGYVDDAMITTPQEPQQDALFEGLELPAGAPKSFEQAILQRRATAHFADTPVPEEVIRAILTAAGQAPSGYNLQPWRFVVVRDRAQRAALQRAAYDQAKVGEAPVVVVACAPAEGWRERAPEIFSESARRGARPQQNLSGQLESAADFVSSHHRATWLNRHVMIAFTYLMLAAEVLGWDTAPMEGFDPAAVRAVLGLPPDAEVVALLAVGRAAGRVQPYPGRLPVSEIAYAERFGQPWPADARQ